MDRDDPLATALEMQRRMFEGSNEALRRSLEFQQSVNQAILEGMDQQREVGQRGAKATREALHSSLDAIESTLPGDVQGVDQVRQAIDEQYEMAEQIGEDAAEATAAGIEQTEAVSAATVDAMDDQLDALADAHEDFETQLRTILEETDDQLDELRSTAEGELADQLGELEGRIEEFRTRLEE